MRSGGLSVTTLSLRGCQDSEVSLATDVVHPGQKTTEEIPSSDSVDSSDLINVVLLRLHSGGISDGRGCSSDMQSESQRPIHSPGSLANKSGNDRCTQGLHVNLNLQPQRRMCRDIIL